MKKTFRLNSLELDKNWSVKFYDHWQSFFNQDNEFETKLNQIVGFVHAKGLDQNFRYSLEIKASQFLIGVFPESKRILICSKFMNIELSLSKLLVKDESQESKDLLNHMGLVASIPVENSPSVIDFITYNNGLADFSTTHYEDVNRQSVELAHQLTDKVSEYKSSLFERLSDFGLDLTANFMLIRIHLLKFLAVLPSLDHDKSGSEVKKLFLETLRRLINDSNLAQIKGLNWPEKTSSSLIYFCCQDFKKSL